MIAGISSGKVYKACMYMCPTQPSGKEGDIVHTLAGYYGAAAAGAADNYSDFMLTRTRESVEDSTLRRLAGIESYQESDVQNFPPLLDLSSFDEGMWWQNAAVGRPGV